MLAFIDFTQTATSCVVRTNKLRGQWCAEKIRLGQVCVSIFVFVSEEGQMGRRTWWINHELSDRFGKNIYPATKKQTSSSQISMFSLILSRTHTGSLWSRWLPVSSLSVSSHHDSLHRGLSISGKTNWITQMRPDTACIRFWCVGVSEMFGLRVMCKCDPCLGLLWPEVFCFDVCSSTAPFNLNWFICLTASFILLPPFIPVLTWECVCASEKKKANIIVGKQVLKRFSVPLHRKWVRMQRSQHFIERVSESAALCRGQHK